MKNPPPCSNREDVIAAELYKTEEGRELLSSALGLCSPLKGGSAELTALTEYFQAPWFYIAEGDYPFPSTCEPRLLDLPPSLVLSLSRSLAPSF